MAWSKIKTKSRKPIGWWYHKIMCEISYHLFRGQKWYHHHLMVMCTKYSEARALNPPNLRQILTDDMNLLRLDGYKKCLDEHKKHGRAWRQGTSAKGIYPPNMVKIKDEIENLKDRHEIRKMFEDARPDSEFKFETPIYLGTPGVGEGDLRIVNLPVKCVFEWSDKIVSDYDSETDTVLEYASGYVMKVVPNQEFVYKGEESTFIASINPNK